MIKEIRRYLLYLSYVGTNYRGSQKHSNSNVLDIDSIQGAVESSLLQLQPNLLNFPTLHLAGRTDAGVHALCTAGHVDMECKSNNLFFNDTSNIVRIMNQHLSKCGHEIRILSCYRVNDNFNARFSATSRTYLYRFLVDKDPHNHKVPIAELGRSLHINLSQDNFDLNRMKQGIQLFRGKKDFTTFSAKSNNKEKVNKLYKKSYVRTLGISIDKTSPLMPFDPLSKQFHYWNIIFTSNSFLYNQIRRIVGALIAFSGYKLTETDILTMLQVPAHNNWNSKILPAPSHGLYLFNVEYNKLDTKQIYD